MSDFTQALMLLWPNGDKKISGLRFGIIEAAPTIFQKYGINTLPLVAQVMAQISHECGAGLDVVENLNYTAERLIEVWPRHFNNSNATGYSYNPKKLANFIYNPPQHTDLGNREGSDDGWNYRGRGATQTTGRDGYAKLGRKLSLDLLNQPDLVNDPRHFLECGVADFILCGCLPFAKAEDIVGVTRKLNGGLVGLEQRRIWLARWKVALDRMPIPSPTTIPPIPKVPPPVVPQPKVSQNIFVSLFEAFLSLFRKGKP